MPPEAEKPKTDEKCMEMAEMAYLPPGVRSFDDAETAKNAQEQAEHARHTAQTFTQIVNNILYADDLTPDQKASLISDAASDMAVRVAKPDMEKSFLGRLLGRKAPMMKMEGGTSYSASDYASVGDDAEPGTWKLRMAEGSSGHMTVAQIARAITAMQPSGFRGNRVSLTAPKSEVMAKIRKAIGMAEGSDEQKDRLRERLNAVKDIEEGVAPGGAFTVYRDKATGEPRWFGIWSNTHVDREAERFTESAHREFESYLDNGGKLPELRLWHEAAAVIGTADHVAYDDNGFMVATGTFNESGKSVYPGLESYPEPLGMSHGYNYRASDLRGGEYHRYRTFEVSVLPLAAAANLKTAFGVEESMALREDKKRMFSAIGGSEFADELEARIAAMAKDTEVDPEVIAGLKDLLEGSDPEPKPEAKPEVAVDTQSLDKALTPVIEGLTAIKAVLDQHAAAITELQKSDDEKLSTAWRKSNLSALRERAASSRVDTIEDGRKAIVRGATNTKEASSFSPNGLDEWYMQAFTGQAAAVPAE